MSRQNSADALISKFSQLVTRLEVVKLMLSSEQGKWHTQEIFRNDFSIDYSRKRDKLFE